MDIDLKKILYNVKGREFPVSGGLGLDVPTRIIVSENYHDFALSLVNEISNVLIDFFKIDLVTQKQTEIVEVDSYRLAIVTVTYECEDGDGDERKEDIALYFDISLSFGNIGRSLEEVKSKEEIDTLVANNRDNALAIQLLPHFDDMVATAITYGSSDLADADFVHLFDVSEIDAKDAMKLLDECGLLDVRVHEYYQSHFGHIYPEGYWEIIW